MKKHNHNVTELLISIVTAQLTGVLSALVVMLSGNSFSVYEEYTKPPLSPRGWLFPVVWVVLYTLMGISAYIVYKSDSEKKENALKLYGIQLFVNFLWSIVFFGFNSLRLSLVVILVLLLLVIAMIMSFRRISSLSAYLNIPYLLWVIFATYLVLGFIFMQRVS
ncbi:MAG: tryptophan-rich sensory protein [Oscillospiraceae bacterium]|nr:tryptophan-rich sensory protein [Oscillospiraceae bacterium]